MPGPGSGSIAVDCGKNGAAQSVLSSSESSLDSRTTSSAFSFSVCTEGLMNASLADRSGTLPVAWSLHLVSRGCHRRGLAAGASDSKSRLTDLGSVTYKVRPIQSLKRCCCLAAICGACWGGFELPATGEGQQVALRFDENFKFNPSLG